MLCYMIISYLDLYLSSLTEIISTQLHQSWVTVTAYVNAKSCSREMEWKYGETQLIADTEGVIESVRGPY